LIVRASSADCASIFEVAMMRVEMADRGEGRGRPQLAVYRSGKPDRAALPKLQDRGSRRGEILN